MDSAHGRSSTGEWSVRTRSCTSTFHFGRILWWAAKRQIASRLAGRAWAGQTAAPPTLRLFRTLSRVNALRPQIFDVVSRNDRAAKLVHLRSPAAIARWLTEVTAGADRTAQPAR